MALLSDRMKFWETEVGAAVLGAFSVQFSRELYVSYTLRSIITRIAQIKFLHNCSSFADVKQNRIRIYKNFCGFDVWAVRVMYMGREYILKPDNGVLKLLP